MHGFKAFMLLGAQGISRAHQPKLQGNPLNVLRRPQGKMLSRLHKSHAISHAISHRRHRILARNFSLIARQIAWKSLPEQTNLCWIVPWLMATIARYDKLVDDRGPCTKRLEFCQGGEHLTQGIFGSLHAYMTFIIQRNLLPRMDFSKTFKLM